MRAGIRLKSDYKGDIEIYVKDSDDAEYRFCTSQHLIEGSFKPYLALAADNKKEGRRNEIDIDAIYVKNQDPTVYNNRNDVENERLTLIAEKYDVIAEATKLGAESE
jgi:hypothetical protein